jgi:hypothetical protein
MGFYRAGSCLPPLEQDEFTSEDKLLNFCPHFLQVYCDFSPPANGTCLSPLEQEEFTSEDKLLNACPHFSHRYFG